MSLLKVCWGLKQVSLLFYESRRKQASWLGIPQEERVYWEQWCINTAIVPPSVSLHEQSAPVSGGVSQCFIALASTNVLAAPCQQHDDAIVPGGSSLAVHAARGFDDKAALCMAG